MCKSNYLKTFILLLIMLCGYMMSCDSEKKIREDLESMQSSKIQFFQDSMICINQEYKNDEKEKQLLKLVVFVDSSECSACALSRLGERYPYLQDFDSLNDFLFLVILESKKLDIEYAKEQLEIASVHTPVYIDTLSIFRKHNPQIPDNKLFHTFLLDESDKVLLVGNPLRNEQIDKLLRKIVKEH